MIPYFSITKGKVDERDPDIDLDYTAGKESKSKTPSFSDIDTRKLAFAEIQARLGDNFTCMTDTYNMMQPVAAHSCAKKYQDSHRYRTANWPCGSG